MNYIIYHEKKFLHFFRNSGEGLCVSVRERGRWGERRTVFEDAREGYSVFLDSEGLIHILCSDKDNNIIYLVNKGSEWNRHIISEGKEEIRPVQFKICRVGKILNFFYTAEYKNEVILVHCVLGVNAMPKTLDTLYDKCHEFSVSGGKVYYTNKDKVLGYRSFSDSVPDSFCRVEKDAVFPYAVRLHDREFLVYKKDDFLCVNGDRIFLDPKSSQPTICIKDNKLILQWLSSGNVRYLTSFNYGTTWSSPMRFIGNNEKVCRFIIQTGDDTEVLYGQNIFPQPVIYGKSNLFFSETPRFSPPVNTEGEKSDPMEYKKLQLLIDIQKNEIKTLKARIKKLENKE